MFFRFFLLTFQLLFAGSSSQPVPLCQALVDTSGRQLPHFSRWLDELLKVNGAHQGILPWRNISYVKARADVTIRSVTNTY